MRVTLVLAGDIESESGGFYYDRRLRDRLRERGHAVEVVSLPRGSYRERLAPNLRARRLADRLSEFDVVVEDGLAHPSVLCANRRLDAPSVALVHMIAWRARAAEGVRSSGTGAGERVRAELGRRGVAAIERRFLRGVDAAVYNAETTRRDAAGLGGPARSVVAPPAGDRFEPVVSASEIRERARSGPLEVTFLGNVVPRKGLDTLVEGVARLDRAAVDWRLTVVGDRTIAPEHVERVEGMTAEAGIGDRVRFAGRLDDATVAARLRESHVLAVPSQYEPFGMVYLEAMGFGCVPLATTAGGASEFVRDGDSGVLVPPGDPRAVSRALRDLDDRDRLAEMGIAARRDYEARPGWPETLDRVVDFLAATGSERPRGDAA
ncbi:glycosyltransferase family 4 protein [Halorubrum ezzemoulense]|jgi:glycosyltransferase involved in cell wall biosynthesis|uniref:Glycosyltransferase family 4 protein n=2 Tax=Halorubrum ezzemoulense TaxID=337243 RepID=A0A256JS05_HALEZ|nr:MULTISPECIES: glycosyltransferase family 4 protein [Halorubrum]MDB2245510.1 glycosyltransferase family 4 protein [Halorubrum ezzemoulense]MDB2250396.1 glycosyltransferase family 4 protein [Halorubrum ezzemoulense]MDB2262772.1 glycosyltransferase family 4 protein [Halorubrum ezzemoulense]MDB2279112.1 glycosyltransferase family 4 protein [Halorubrum ezzemoulense]MDB2285652.1 glycosyltransferase family 4 protein [Halorubrum ezzemoulense]